MHEYGKRPISRPLPRYDGEKHYDEAKIAAQSKLVEQVAAVINDHQRVREWYDPEVNLTQYHCGCRMWFYDHAAHQAQEIVEALELE